MNKDNVLLYLIKKEQCCPLDFDEQDLKDQLEDGEFKDAQDIIANWTDCVLDEEEIETLTQTIKELKTKDFKHIIELVNKTLEHENNNGEFDGLANELEEYFTNYEDWENYEN